MTRADSAGGTWAPGGSILTARDRFEVLRLAAGDPRAIAELHDAYARGTPRADGSRVPDTSAIRARFAAELAALPGTTAELVRAAAGARPGEDLSAVLAGADPAALAPAEDRGLIVVRDDTVDFPDPLARLAAWWSTPAAARIDLHRRLAAVAPNPVHRAWYRAQAGIGEPAQIAADLEFVATTGPDPRIDDITGLWERAAGLSAPAEAARRLVQALICAAGLGDPARVGALHRRILALTDDPDIVETSASVVAVALTRCGLPGATGRLVTVDGAWRRAQLSAGADPAGLAPVLRLCRRQGGVGLGAEAAVRYAEHLVNAARWAEALVLIDELEGWATTGGWTAIEVDAAALRALVHAFRGEHDAATAILDRVWHLIDLAENPAGHVRLLRASAATAMVVGDWAGAYRHLRAMYTPAGEPLHPAGAAHSIAELATSATRCGARDEVAGIVRATQAAHAGTSSARLRLLLHQAAALVLDEDVERHHRLAVTDPEGVKWPLDQALARVRYGEWLRRQRRPLDARSVIRAALETFERLGAPSVAEITRHELRAAGQVDESSDPDDPLARLTPQERQVVTLAARGLRNRAIAEQLFLSARTVAFHLYKAYPKLGVDGRHQLPAVVAS